MLVARPFEPQRGMVARLMTSPTPQGCLWTLETRAMLAEQPNDEGATYRLQLALAWALPILRAHVARELELSERPPAP